MSAQTSIASKLLEEIEHLQALLAEQDAEIRSLQKQLAKTAKDRTRHRDRSEELRTELAKYVRADSQVLRGKRK
jgi:predicted  nucleic acid-binding Zn-ribbon protein